MAGSANTRDILIGEILGDLGTLVDRVEKIERDHNKTVEDMTKAREALEQAGQNASSYALESANALRVEKQRVLDGLTEISKSTNAASRAFTLSVRQIGPKMYAVGAAVGVSAGVVGGGLVSFVMLHLLH